MQSFGNAAGVVKAFSSAAKQLKPPPDLLPSEWAEQSIYIPIGNAIPGLIRFDNAPYQREPLNMTANADCERITLMWGAQVGKTMLALCAQAHRIVQNPSSQIMMQPSQGDLHTWLETKFNPMVEANRELQERIAKPRSREGVNNQSMKSYPGGFMMYSWSGSPKTMRGRSAPFVVCDETDGYDRTHEGHPVSLLWQRAATFGDQSLLLEISTPTIKGNSWIEAAYLEGDQRRFFVPCPHCDHHQALEWERVHWTQDDEGNELPETAAYTCESCGVLWNDGERVAAIRSGQWRAKKPFRGHASYHLNELYSCFRKLRDVVRSYLNKRAADDLQTFTNVSLAETWEETGEQADEDALMARAEEYAAPVPAGGLVLTAGVDMQQDRLECEVVAWGQGDENWSVDYRVLWGDPLQPEVWEELDSLLAETWQHESGALLEISAAGLDTGGTGGYTQAAYDYAKTKTGHRLFAMKGQAGWGRPVAQSPQRKKSGKRGRKVDLFIVGVDEAKLSVMRRLAVENPGPGYCHFPNGRETEWYAQLTSEKLITRYVKGYPVREWHQTRARNEALDCRVYAYAAYKIASLSLETVERRIQRWVETVKNDQKTSGKVENSQQNIEKKPHAPENPQVEDNEAETDTPVITARRKIKRKRGAKRKNYATQW